MMPVIFRKVNKTLTTRGLKGTVRYLMTSDPRDIMRSAFVPRSKGRSQIHKFDREYEGIDTSGVVDLSEVSLDGQSWKYGHGYQAVNWRGFMELFDQLDIDHSEFVFIDVGSGKGRALLLASSYPFKEVIGVELVEEWHRIAEENIRKFPDAEKKCKNIRSVCSDALSYDLPDEPLVIFFYNPFTAPLVESFVQKVLDLQHKYRQLIYVVYFQDLHAEIFRQKGLRPFQAGELLGDSWSMYKIGSSEA
ncbi:MAG TPA: class I SAM-dependent methyltransferase [Gammaproteobacteria bacterium]|nr:class I SAM-dependent methyltransferase [Gammaproteobacteria bacterium]